MGWDTPDVYNQPEKFGLTPVADIDFGSGYEFEMIVVWAQEDFGLHFWAADSGCSCNSPFEEFTTLDSVDPLTLLTLPVFKETVTRGGTDYEGNLTQEADVFLERIEKLIRPPFTGAWRGMYEAVV